MTPLWKWKARPGLNSKTPSLKKPVKWKHEMGHSWKLLDNLLFRIDVRTVTVPWFKRMQSGARIWKAISKKCVSMYKVELVKVGLGPGFWSIVPGCSDSGPWRGRTCRQEHKTRAVLLLAGRQRRRRGHGITFSGVIPVTCFLPCLLMFPRSWGSSTHWAPNVQHLSWRGSEV